MITLRTRFRNCLEYKIIQIARNVKYVYTDPENCTCFISYSAGHCLEHCLEQS